MLFICKDSLLAFQLLNKLFTCKIDHRKAIPSKQVAVNFEY